ncbi:MarR family winged helix-turn-helix transcriptional regulator [Nocardia sp. NPDC004068]|uniref:MarR family winged helix-turn-helix transcriptional regulator n=1 Tax=Nocardia sp. NPDC004068 TaxID=3364303 RepID=UPI003686D45E
MSMSRIEESATVEGRLVDIAVIVARLSRLASGFGGDGLPRAMVRALSVLDEHGPMRVGDFARIDGCSQPTATTLIGRLVAAGLVARATVPGDSRAVVVEPTAAGRARLAASRRAIGTALAARSPGFDHERLARLSDELRALHAALVSTAATEFEEQER